MFGETQKVEGPRLGDPQVQASTYGMGIPQIWGAMRLAGNVILARDLIEKRNKQSAGKGGGGQTVVSYEYFATFAVAFASGPVDAIRRVWADGKLLVDPSLPEAVSFTNEAASLKPYAPVHIEGNRDGAGDLTITWTRRTRFIGEWRDLVDVPLNEASEASYEIDVLDGSGQVVRTLSSTTPPVTYSAADQTSVSSQRQLGNVSSVDTPATVRRVARSMCSK